MNPEKSVTITYLFYLADGQRLQFDLALARPGLTLRNTRRQHPEWAALTHHQCPHCPLKAGANPQCPLAANLAEVVETFKDGVATDEAEIVIRTENRSYGRRAPLSQGISAMIGLIMVTSGCPVMDKLRPMAYTHLPFASKEETLFRSLSSYLLGQYFVQRRGGTPDWSFTKLVDIYDDINVVNEHVSRRLEKVCTRDASLNALTKLDCFASIAAISLESNSLDDIENMFHAYFEAGGGTVRKAPAMATFGTDEALAPDPLASDDAMTADALEIDDEEDDA